MRPISTPSPRSPALSRRTLLGAFPLLSGLLWPRRGQAAVASSDRRFLFVFVDGGWDPTWVFHPAFDDPAVDMPPDGSDLATSGDLRWVSGPGRPQVDSFFESFASDCCILNGLEVRSIAHERCRRLLLTGTPSGTGMGIPSRLAAAAGDDTPLGHVVFSGPAYVDEDGAEVVRLGVDGQLQALLDGTCVDGTDALRLGSDTLTDLEDAFVASRAQAAADQAGEVGAEARLTGAYARSLDRLTVAQDNRDLLAGGRGETPAELAAAVELLSSGLARSAIVADLGFRGERWDHHSDLSRQAPSYDFLFSNLSAVCRSMASQPGRVADRLLDEVTIVVVSEMGRAPGLNASMGKDHWMYGSALLIGGGIRGGQVAGGFLDGMAPAALDPTTGAPVASGGVVPRAAHLDATLMALAGIDPTPVYGEDVVPLTGLLA